MGEKKLAKVEVRISAADKATLQRLAEAEGFSLGELLRRRALAVAPAAVATQATEPAAPSQLPAAAAKKAPPLIVALPRYKLDDIGPDPFRGGLRSGRR